MMIKTDLKLYSVRDVSQMFRVVPSRIRTIIGHGRIPDARYVGTSWAIPEDAVVLPDPETELSPAEMYAKHGGNITRYIALCEERSVPARIPPYEWFEPEPSRPQRRLSPAIKDRVWALYETERRSPYKIASHLGLSEKVVKRYINRRLKETEPDIRSCLICGGTGELIAENEQFGDLAFPCRECSGTGEAPRE